jgi:hypothetical protein
MPHRLKILNDAFKYHLIKCQINQKKQRESFRNSRLFRRTLFDEDEDKDK